MTVVHIISGLQSGGAEGVLYRLCTGDPSNRHVVISFTDEGKYGAPLTEAGVTVHALRMPRSRVTLRGLRELRTLLRQYRPDVVQTWMYHADLVGGLVAKLSGGPRLCWGIRSGEILWTSGQRLTALIRVLNGLLSWIVPDRILCNSAVAAGLHRRIGYSGRKLTVVPNGVDVELFRPDAGLRRRVRESWGIAGDEPLLGSIGRDTPYKDHDTLISALSRLKLAGVSFRCVIVGAGMTEHNPVLARKLDAAGVRDVVRLCGERNDIPGVMNALDVCVLSSAAEASPGVLIEAMACGVPCVTTDVGDAASIVADTGWIVPRRNPQALATALEGAISESRDPSRNVARRQACRERVVTRFSLGQMLRGFHDAWEPSHA